MRVPGTVNARRRAGAAFRQPQKGSGMPRNPPKNFRPATSVWLLILGAAPPFAAGVDRRTCRDDEDPIKTVRPDTWATDSTLSLEWLLIH